MKKFNLLKEIIIVDKEELLQAINSQKEFGITIDGSITYQPHQEIVIYKGKHTTKHSALSPQKPLDITEFLGNNYKIAESEGKIGIKASLAWQDIIGYNYDLASYDDTTTDGVSEFAEKELEELGWYADEFEIKYRELIDLVENECDGILLCIEQEKPDYRFSGLGFIQDTKQTYDAMFAYAQKKVQEKIKNDPLYSVDNLNEDEEEAARYFNVI